MDASLLTRAAPAGQENPAGRRWASLKGRRKLWLEVHLWLGLVAGAFMVIIGLTGSIMVYFKEIDGWLHPEMEIVAAPAAGEAAYRPLSEIVAAAQAALPVGARVGSAYYPHDEHGVFWFYAVERMTPGQRPDVTNVFVNPYTAQVTGIRLYRSGEHPFAGSLTGFLFNIHPSLLLGPFGTTLVGVLCVLALVSTLSGLILWWPITGKWRLAFTFKRDAGGVRLNHDIHKLAGLYLAPVLVVVLVSGVYFNLRPQFVWLVELFSPVTKRETVLQRQQTVGTPLGIDAVLARVKAQFPDGRLYSFSLPSPSLLPGMRPQPYAVGQLVPTRWGFVGRREILIDRISGEVLRVGDPFRGSAGDIFMQWQWPLHSGFFYGMTGRVLVLLSGIACAVLYVTGVIRWWRKRQARARQAQRLAGEA